MKTLRPLLLLASLLTPPPASSAPYLPTLREIEDGSALSWLRDAASPYAPPSSFASGGGGGGGGGGGQRGPPMGWMMPMYYGLFKGSAKNNGKIG